MASQQGVFSTVLGVWGPCMGDGEQRKATLLRPTAREKRKKQLQSRYGVLPALKKGEINEKFTVYT